MLAHLQLGRRFALGGLNRHDLVRQLVDAALQPRAHAVQLVLLVGLRALRLFQLRNDLLGLALRLLHDPARVVLGLSDHRFALAFVFPAFLLGLTADALRLDVRLLRQLLLLLGNLPVILGVRDYVLKANLVARQALARGGDQRLGQTQLARNLKRVALSRHADGQPVRGPQRLHVEFHRRVLHALGAQRERLQFGIVRRRQRRHMQIQQML